MKRVGHLYEAIYDIENIKLAIYKASTGKRKQKHVAKILADIDSHAIIVQELLKSGSYRPSPYTIRRIKDGASQKEREISKPKFFPDQVIHWALMIQLDPIIIRGMYRHSCGSVPGRGSSYGQKKINKWLKDRQRTKYCVKLDIAKFYPSIDNAILKDMFRRKVKDDKTLCLIDLIIDSASGLPIGNYTSQWFANFFLEGLDHFIKSQPVAAYYIRYVDDIVIFGSNKRKLHKLKDAIEDYINGIGLRLKGNWQVFKTDSRPLDFLGLKFYRTHTTLRARNSIRIKRRAKRIHRKGFLTLKDAQAIISYWGWIKRSNSYCYYNKHIKPYISIIECRKVVSKHGKANHTRGST